MCIHCSSDSRKQKADLAPSVHVLQVVRKLEAELDVPRMVRMHWTGCPNSCGQVNGLGRHSSMSAPLGCDCAGLLGPAAG